VGLPDSRTTASLVSTVPTGFVGPAPDVSNLPIAHILSRSKSAVRPPYAGGLRSRVIANHRLELTNHTPRVALLFIDDTQEPVRLRTPWGDVDVRLGRVAARFRSTYTPICRCLRQDGTRDRVCSSDGCSGQSAVIVRAPTTYSCASQAPSVWGAASTLVLELSSPDDSGRRCDLSHSPLTPLIGSGPYSRPHPHAADVRRGSRENSPGTHQPSGPRDLRAQ
jgi:hypothetical protein